MGISWSWSTLSTDSAGGSLTGLACISDTNCVAVGSAQQNSGGYQITDFVKHISVFVRAGHTYLAKPGK